MICFSLVTAGAMPAVLAAKPAKTPLDRVEIIASTTEGGGSLVDFKASITETTTLPATITIIAEDYFTLTKAASFSASNPKKLNKINYEQVSSPGEIMYTFILDKDRAISLEFTSESLTTVQASHVIFTIGWTMFSDTRSVLIGTIVPENYIGNGPEVVKFGQDLSGNSIFGRAYNGVEAGTECITSMAFVSANPGGANVPTEAEKAEAEKAAAAKRTNTMLIMGVSALLLVAVIMLIVLIVRGRRTNVDDFDGPEDEDDAEFGDEVDYEDDEEPLFEEEVYDDYAEEEDK